MKVKEERAAQLAQHQGAAALYSSVTHNQLRARTKGSAEKQ